MICPIGWMPQSMSKKRKTYSCAIPAREKMKWIKSQSSVEHYTKRASRMIGSGTDIIRSSVSHGFFRKIPRRICPAINADHALAVCVCRASGLRDRRMERRELLLLRGNHNDCIFIGLTLSEYRRTALEAKA